MEFHQAIGKVGTMDLRFDLISEEFNEFIEAVQVGDRENILKENCDLLYVVYGAGWELGYDLDKAFRRVHKSNMSKFINGKPVFREDGKVLKGKFYKPPKLTDLVM